MNTNLKSRSSMNARFASQSITQHVHAIIRHPMTIFKVQQASAPRRLSPMFAKSEAAARMHGVNELKRTETRQPTIYLPDAILTRRLADCFSDASLFSLLKAHQMTLNPIHLAAATKAMRRLNLKESSPSAQLVLSLMAHEAAPSRILSACPPRELSSIAWACAQVFPKPGQASALISQAAKVMLSSHAPALTIQGLCNLYWAFASWSCSEEAELLELLDSYLKDHLTASGHPNWSAQDVSMLLWSMAKLSHLPCDTITEGLTHQALSIMDSEDRSSSITSQGLSNIIWAVGILSRLTLKDTHDGSMRIKSLTQLVERASALTPYYSFKLVELSACMTGLSLVIQSFGSDDHPSIKAFFDEILARSADSLKKNSPTLRESIGPVASIMSSFVPLTAAVSVQLIEAFVVVVLDIVVGAKISDVDEADFCECSTVVWAMCSILSSVSLSSVDSQRVQMALSCLMSVVTKALSALDINESAMARVFWACKMRYVQYGQVYSSFLSSDTPGLGHLSDDFIISSHDAHRFFSQALHVILHAIGLPSLRLYASVLWSLSSRLEDSVGSLSAGHLSPNYFSESKDGLEDGWSVVCFSPGSYGFENDIQGLARKVMRRMLKHISILLFESSLSDLPEAHQNHVAALSVASSR